METKEKRPRIPTDLADRIDVQRAEIPFEQFVRNALEAIVGPFVIEPDPDKPRRYRVLGEDGAVMGNGHTKDEANRRVYMLAAAHMAHAAAMILEAQAEDVDYEELLTVADAIADAANDATQMLTVA